MYKKSHYKSSDFFVIIYVVMIMEALIYAITFICFMFITFFVLRASRLEEAFKQGRVTEIRVAYVIISLISAYLLTELVFRMLSFAGVNL